MRTVWLGLLGGLGWVLAALAADRAVVIEGVPHVRQKPDFCGEACAEMVLRKLGRVGMDQDYVFNVSGLDPALARGCHTPELKTAVIKIGFAPGAVGTWIPAKTAAEGLAAEWGKLLADLQAGIPAIVCTHFDARPKSAEHLRLVVGYDPATDEVIYHDPAIADGGYLRMKLSRFKELWPLKYEADRWLLVRFRMKEDQIAAAAPPPAGFTNADYAQHLMALQKRLPAAGFTVVVQRPFVVIGDEDAETVKMRAERTVKWASDQLKSTYFSQDPKAIIDVWLFRDKESYEANTKRIFKETPTTPFGYYSSLHEALIMNIATGGGTLVHEIVHPFVAANFPECPAWFNEGLGSLYEQSQERDGHIRGLTNWRLDGLQQALRAKTVPSFKDLCLTDSDTFYHEKRGINYAQARYLCYYLQEKGLLQRFYREFTAAVRTDPGGYATLQKVLGEKDMADFHARWQQWVLGLKFPPST